MKFSNVLKLLREQKGLSQREIADYLGVTRQAIASYETGKREPGFDTLSKLADYFDVTADYLLGRLGCGDINAYAIVRNLRLIRGNLTYEQFCEKISLKMGVFIFPEIYEMYENGERIPCTGTIKMLARYACVHETFFYCRNTPETLENERKQYEEGLKQSPYDSALGRKLRTSDTAHKKLLQWAGEEENLPYVRLAKKLKENGVETNEVEVSIRAMLSNSQSSDERLASDVRKAASGSLKTNT